MTRPKVFQPRPESLEARKEKAFEDYWALGIHRSLNKLMRYYQRLAKEEGPDKVPTLSRSVLYRWAKEGNWETRARERDREIYERARKTIAEARIEGYKTIADLLPKALAVIERILTHPDDELMTPSIRLKASELVIQIANLKDLAREAAQQEQAAAPPPLPADLPESEEALADYYRRLIGG